MKREKERERETENKRRDRRGTNSFHCEECTAFAYSIEGTTKCPQK